MPNIEFMEAHGELVGVAPKPEPAIDMIPEWWRNQPSFMNDGSIVNGNYQTTIKKCQAIFDSISSGYIIKCPIDIQIDTTNGGVQTQIPAPLQPWNQHFISAHPRSQMSNFPIDNDLYVDTFLRIHPVWVFKTSPGYSALIMPLAMREPLPVMAVTAVVDSDKFISDGHISFFVKKGFKGVIKQGTPLFQVIPFKREEWTHSFTEFNNDIIEKQRKVVRSTFMNGYKLKYWTKKVFK